MQKGEKTFYIYFKKAEETHSIVSCSTRNTSPCNLCIMTLVISIGFAILLSSKPSSFETQLKWYGILRKAHVICCINWPNSTYLKHNSYDTLGYDLGRPILKIIFCCPFKVSCIKNKPDFQYQCDASNCAAVRGRFTSHHLSLRW